MSVHRHYSKIEELVIENLTFSLKGTNWRACKLS